MAENTNIADNPVPARPPMDGAALSPIATAKPWQSVACSRSQWYQLLRSGRTPLPVARLGTRRPVWLISELAAWLQAGAPDRQTWELMKQRGIK